MYISVSIINFPNYSLIEFLGYNMITLLYYSLIIFLYLTDYYNEMRQEIILFHGIRFIGKDPYISLSFAT